jgi:hypothetical protein
MLVIARGQKTCNAAISKHSNSFRELKPSNTFGHLPRIESGEINVSITPDR